MITSTAGYYIDREERKHCVKIVNRFELSQSLGCSPQNSLKKDRNQQHKDMGEVITNLPIATGKSFMDLDDNCLISIFSLNCFTITDLCSIAETNFRLRKVASRIFSRTQKKYNLESLLGSPAGTRILFNFGSVVTSVSIGSLLKGETSTNLLHLVAKYCSNSLKSLSLYDCNIDQDLTIKLRPLINNLHHLHLRHCNINGVYEDLFSSCGSLVELAVDGEEKEYMRSLLLNSFPKLERFLSSVDSFFDEYILKNFIRRHPNLKFVNCSANECSYLLPIIAHNCMQLAELEISLEIINCRRISSTVEEAFDSVLVLNHLRKLTINCNGRNATLITKKLSCMSSLESLNLKDVKGDSEFIPALSQLKGLRALRLVGWEFYNLNPLGNLDQLTDLSILSIRKVDLHLDQIIKRLNNLKTLNLNLHTFKIDEAMYLRIANVVQGREARFQHTLELTCGADKGAIANLQNDAHNNRIVKLNIIG